MPKIVIKRRPRNNISQLKKVDEETEVSKEVHNPSLILTIKANGRSIHKNITQLDEGFDSDSSSSDDFSPPYQVNTTSSGGKSLQRNPPVKRRRSEEEPTIERSHSGRVKRKKHNIVGSFKIISYGWTCRILPILGNSTTKKVVLQLIRTGLSGGFVSGMVNSSQKDGFFLLLYDNDETMRAAGIFHIEHCGKSSSYVLLSVFATDPNFRKQGLGRLLTAYLIHKAQENHYRIVVLARPEAVSFWCHFTMCFRRMTTEECKKFNRPTKKKKDDLVDLIYEGQEEEDVISFALLRFSPKSKTIT